EVPEPQHLLLPELSDLNEGGRGGTGVQGGMAERDFEVAFDAALDELAALRTVEEVAPCLAGRLADAFGAADAHVRLEGVSGDAAVASGTGRWRAVGPGPGDPGLQAPVALHGGVVGILTVGPGGLESAVGSQRAGVLLDRFARLVAVAASAARLVEADRTVRVQQQGLLRAGQALSVSLVLRDVLAAILRELRSVVHYDTASVQQLRGDA